MSTQDVFNKLKYPRKSFEDIRNIIDRRVQDHKTCTDRVIARVCKECGWTFHEYVFEELDRSMKMNQKFYESHGIKV